MHRYTLPKQKKFILLYLFIFIVFFLNAHANPIRIMPLGDSITQGINGSLEERYQSAYRSELYHTLQNEEYLIDFVGSQVQGYDLYPRFDYNHEGYAWWTSYNIANYVYGFLVNNQPDIVLLHIGSNDTSPNQADSSSIEGVRAILNQIDLYESHYNHPVRVILATIINRRAYHRTVQYFNLNLRNLANARIAAGDILTLVDMEYGAEFTYYDYSDSVHPNESGYAKMANVWFEALTQLLPPPTPIEPTDINLLSVESHSATLTWNDTSVNEDGYKIYNGETLIATLEPNTSSYRLENLTANTTYSFSIVAYNVHGNSESINIIFTTEDDFGWLVAINHMILN